MIPIKLTLKNFMSYGDEPTTLSFAGWRVACLSGDNGNGKSALLDAMTYALWGKTRAEGVRAISEDDLIRVGTDEMEVRFEFELNDTRYRAVKKRRRGKSSGSEWSLAQQTDEGTWIGIGGGNQRDTGKQIVALLSMEYETFLNSAYLQQGRADEFTRQRPNDRKRILGEILGLDKYDRLEAKARDRQKDSKERAEELEREIKVLEGEIARLPDQRAQLEEDHVRLEDAQSQHESQQAIVKTLAERKAKLDAVADQVANMEDAYRRSQTELQEREREKSKKQERLARIQAVLDQREAILADYAALVAARERAKILEPRIQEYNQANAELQNVIGAIDIEKLRITNELTGARRDLKDIETRVREVAQLDANLAALTDELKAEKAVVAQLAVAQSDLQAAQESFASVKARNETIKTELAELADVLALLQRPHAQCPVCESDLRGPKHEAVVRRQGEKQARLCEEQEQIKRQGAAVKAAQTQAQAQTDALTRLRDDLSVKRRRFADYGERRDSLIQQGTDAQSAHALVQKLESTLQTNDYAAPQRVRRQRLEKELERLGLAKKEHEAVALQIARLEDSVKRYQDLQHAEGIWEQERGDLTRLESLIAERQKEAEAQKQQRDALDASLGQYEAVKRETIQSEIERDRIQREINNLHVSIGTLEKYIAQGEAAETAKKVKQEAWRKADEERRLYQALTTAFGRKGVQALIIENAVPELEDEANGLLARMTDNAMTLRFVTTKAAKTTGNEIETLDITITDDAGNRPYELFSGGEAFRINFAIRIALSRLLARRSGAKLQTLILDEGFGTQDGKGREKLVEVIESIKDDFEKILIITHVEELKDAFPNRFEVVKGANGSQIHAL